MVVITCCSDMFNGAEVILMSILAGCRLLWVLGLLYQVESATAAEHFKLLNTDYEGSVFLGCRVNALLYHW